MAGTRRAGSLLALALLAASLPRPAAAQADDRVVFPASALQGAMVLGKVPPGSRVEYAGRTLRTTGYGTVVFGIGRDEKGPASISVMRPDGSRETASVTVTPRDWREQRVDGVPPATVDPPPAIAERIRLEVSAEQTPLPERMTISMGVYTTHDGSVTAEACVQRADEAMYEAKNSGRNRVVIWRRQGR